HGTRAGSFGRIRIERSLRRFDTAIPKYKSLLHPRAGQSHHTARSWNSPRAAQSKKRDPQLPESLPLVARTNRTYFFDRLGFFVDGRELSVDSSRSTSLAGAIAR